MLKVLLVSRCRKKALERTRRILDQYALRIGERTWQTPITREGLDRLRAHLNEQASRGTAVACHGVSRGRHQLWWIVGRQEAFADDGRIPGRHRSRYQGLLRGDRQRFAMMPWLSEALGYAGLGHDTGKDTTYFQGKLVDAQCLEPYRHEWVSLYRLAQLAGETPADLSAVLPEPVTEQGLSLETLARHWIMAHHRLPTQSQPSEYEKSHGPERLQQPPELDLEHLQEARLFDVDPDLAKRLREQMAALRQRAIPVSAFGGAFLYGRLALMLADHYASRTLPASQARVALEGEEAGSQRPLLAHARRNKPVELAAKSADADGQQLGIGDHCRDVARLAPRALRQIAQHERLYPGLSPESRSQILQRAGPAYRWQDELTNQLLRIFRQRAHDDDGGFVVLCAGTGTGKTRAGAKAATAMNVRRNCRFNTLLGLRNLTLQTGEAYRQELGLGTQELTTLIGAIEPREFKDFHETSEEAADDEQADLGEQTYQGQSAPRLPRLIAPQARTADQRRLLGTPVFVGTIDYLMQATATERARHLLPQLRLASSDVILDEIDDYDLDDLGAILRLAYQVGAFGRRLILSSATATPEIVSALGSAYAEGFRTHAAITGKTERIHAVFANDQTRLKYQVCPDGEGIGSAYKHFADRVARRARAHYEQAPLHRGWISDEPLTSEQPPLQTLRALHRDNAIEAGAGIRFSTGLWRIAHIDRAVHQIEKLNDYAHELSREGILLKVVPYHARLPQYVRAYTEEQLDRLLKRKADSSADPILAHASIEHLIRQAHAHGYSDVILLVVATPVEEVGRDHDFDFAMIEPSSSRSIIQCVGRVNRHRRRVLAPGQYNIAVFRHNHRGEEGKTPCFQRPGFEDGNDPLPSHDLRELAPELVAKPHAAPLLGRPEKGLETLPAYEREKMRQRLAGALKPILEDPRFHYTAKHAIQDCRFRKGPPTMDFFFWQEGYYWYNELGEQAKQDQAVDWDILWIQKTDLEKYLERFAAHQDSELDAAFCRRYAKVSVIKENEEPRDQVAQEHLFCHQLGVYQRITDNPS